MFLGYLTTAELIIKKSFSEIYLKDYTLDWEIPHF